MQASHSRAHAKVSGRSVKKTRHDRGGELGQLMPQPLPNNPYATGTPTHQAYATCVTLEAGRAPADWTGPPTEVCARLLGYMIIHSPTDDGRTNITNEINSCNADGMALHKLAKFYVDHYLRPCT
jgi:hypothetical protein